MHKVTQKELREAQRAVANAQTRLVKAEYHLRTLKSNAIEQKMKFEGEPVQWSIDCDCGFIWSGYYTTYAGGARAMKRAEAKHKKRPCCTPHN